jgi:hypothetical protein
MNQKILRRVFVGSIISGLAMLPFGIRYLRKRNPVTLLSEHIQNEIHFEPFSLPHQNINQFSLLACFSADEKSIIASYSRDDHWHASICMASVTDNFSQMPKFSVLTDFKPTSLITSLGCSSQKQENNQTYQQVSYTLRSVAVEAKEMDRCDEVLYRVPIFPDSQLAKGGVTPLLLLMGSGRFPKKYLTTNRWLTPHCWNTASDELFFASYLELRRYNAKSVLGGKGIYRFRETKDAVERNQNGKYICSNIFDVGDGSIRFIEASLKGQDGKITQQNLVFGDGDLVTLNSDGKEVERIPFPTLPFGRIALLTHKHWFFAEGIAERQFAVAPLDNPRKFTLLKFPDDELILRDGKLAYNFHPCGITQDGKSCLCVRTVTSQRIEFAKQNAISLCDLGLVRLPFPVT